MHNYGTCKLNSRALWQIPIRFAIKRFFETQSPFENCLQNGILELFTLCTTLDPALIQIVIRGVRSKIKIGAQCLVPSDMLERWLQVFGVHITLTLLPTNHCMSPPTNSMKYYASLIPMKSTLEKYATQP